jgi:hypothetical protein
MARLGGGLAVSLMLVSAAVSLLGLMRAPSLAYADDPPVVRDAAVWLKHNLELEKHFARADEDAITRIMTPSPAIAFYAMGAWHHDFSIDLPWATCTELEAFVEREWVGILAIPEWTVLDSRHPAAPCLLGAPLATKRWRPVATIGAAPPRRVFLHRVLP